VIILTAFGLDEYVVEALRAGARAFVLKKRRLSASLLQSTRSRIAERSSTPP
jgi:DNA-binding NarL/FixJ family response regulator